MRFIALVFLCLWALIVPGFSASPDEQKTAAMKADLLGKVDATKTRSQIMVDQIFSFGELGFQEFETSKYLTETLEKEGFKVQRGIAGIPTAWTASRGLPITTR
jgi:aminobenzoyl-glutamate utilization protein B